jgi:hypothetical protein
MTSTAPTGDFVLPQVLSSLRDDDDDDDEVYSPGSKPKGP